MQVASCFNELLAAASNTIGNGNAPSVCPCVSVCEHKSFLPLCFLPFHYPLSIIIVILLLLSIIIIMSVGGWITQEEGEAEGGGGAGVVVVSRKGDAGLSRVDSNLVRRT